MMDLTNEPWAVLPAMIPEPPRRPDGRGRPWRDAREGLNGILWVLRTGAQGKHLPERYPPYPTCHRRFQHGVRSGVFERIRHALAAELEERGGLELSECFLDGTFVVAKTGGAVWERPRGARGRRSWPWQTVRVVLSPSTLRRLRRMQSPLLSQLSPRVLSLADRSG